jgi:hypothetical protein
MYKVLYYMTAGHRTSKLFDNISDALLFCVYHVKTGDVFDLYKVEE